MPNQLAAERSLYLRQHADNPVPWMPWGEEAFARARREQKLVFLSIGYSACHWCHVMEEESFADPEVAAILERWYIPIKVDREERPDVDALYMSICQAMTGQGGWPLTVILTPEREVIFTGTYFPKRSTPYRIGLIELLERIAALWQQDGQMLRSSAHALMERIAPHLRSAHSGHITAGTISAALEQLDKLFDRRYGGFGTRPKFPMAAALWFLLIAGPRTSTRALDIATATLEAMRWGGIWDHVGFGFHRYSTDERWFLPHFEKMLYDQALLLLVYAEAARITKRRLFETTAMEVAAYLDRTLLLEHGAFAASEDADTPDGEGAFYQWRYEDLRRLIPSHEFERMRAIFHLSPEGNAHDEATGQPTGRNILYAGMRTEDVLERFGGTLEEFLTWWEPLRQRLETVRNSRARPARDEKVLCDWNALAVAALARAGRLLRQPTLIERARRTWSYLERVHVRADGTLAHCSYSGESAIDGFLDDYAFAAWAALELYHATGANDFLEHVEHLLHTITERFVDGDGIVRTAASADVLPLTEHSDGATVSGIGITALVAAVHGVVAAEQTSTRLAEHILQRYGGSVQENPVWHATLLCAWLHASECSLLDIECPSDQREELEQFLAKHYDPLRIDRVVNYAASAFRAQRCRNAACIPLTSWEEFCRNVPLGNQSTLEASHEQ